MLFELFKCNRWRTHEQEISNIRATYSRRAMMVLLTRLQFVFVTDIGIQKEGTLLNCTVSLKNITTDDIPPQRTKDFFKRT